MRKKKKKMLMYSGLVVFFVVLASFILVQTGKPFSIYDPCQAGQTSRNLIDSCYQPSTPFKEVTCTPSTSLGLGWRFDSCEAVITYNDGDVIPVYVDSGWNEQCGLYNIERIVIHAMYSCEGTATTTVSPTTSVTTTVPFSTIPPDTTISTILPPTSETTSSIGVSYWCYDANNPVVCNREIGDVSDPNLVCFNSQQECINALPSDTSTTTYTTTETSTDTTTQTSTETTTEECYESGVTSYDEAHQHTYCIDEYGNGETSVNDGHWHEIRNGEVLWKDGHTHTLVESGSKGFWDDLTEEEKRMVYIVIGVIIFLIVIVIIIKAVSGGSSQPTVVMSGYGGGY